MEKKSMTAEKATEKKESKKEKYYYAIGRRKSAIAQVRLFETKKGSGEVEIKINDRQLDDYFTIDRLRKTVTEPLIGTAQSGNFYAQIRVRGGGIKAQAEAIRLAVARSLVVYDESFKKALSDLGFIKRDSRRVERKKPGLKKARKSPQWAKR